MDMSSLHQNELPLFSAYAAIVHSPHCRRSHSPQSRKRGEEFARENNSRPLLIVDFLLKIFSCRFSAIPRRPLKTI